MNGVLSFAQWAKSSSINENVKAAKSYLIKKYADINQIEEITPEVEQAALNNRAYKNIRELLKGNDGYVYAFVKFNLDHATSLTDLTDLYTKIKENAGSLTSLPMTIEEYSKQESVHGLNPFEALRDALNKISNQRKYKWVIEKVNGTLRRAIKQSFNETQLDELYDAAKLIDDADEKLNILPTDEKSNRRTLLKATNRYSNPLEYLEYVKSSAEGAADTDISEKINSIRAIQPQAGILYYKNKRLVISVRTESAQKSICTNVSNWCINDWAWKNYAGKNPESLQINIYDFNLSPTDHMFTTGTTIDQQGRVDVSNNKANHNIAKSTDVQAHFSGLGYPEDLVNAIVSKIPLEQEIKKILTSLGVDNAKAADVLNTLVKVTYRLDLEANDDLRNVIVGILEDELSNSLSREEIFNVYIKSGVNSIFSARILNILMPNLTDEEKTKILNKNDQLMNDPTRGFKYILSNFGRSAYPQVAKVVDDYDKIKDIIISGESIS